MIVNRVEYAITADARQAIGEMRALANAAEFAATRAATAVTAATAGAEAGIIAAGSAGGFSLGKTAKGIKGGTMALKQVGGALAPLGMGLSPSELYPLMMAGQTMRGLNMAAANLGTSLGVLSLALVGVGIAAGTAYKGFQALSAQLGEKASSQSLAGTTQDLARRLMPLLRRANATGRVDDQVASAWMMGLSDVATGNRTGDEAESIVRKVQRSLLKSTPAAAGSAQLRDLQLEMDARAKGGLDLKLFQIEKEFGKIFNDAFDLAKNSRLDFKPIGDSILAAQAKAEADARAAEAPKPAPSPRFDLPVSNLERMGFIINPGLATGVGAVNDFSRQTATNTGKTNVILERIHGKLGNPDFTRQ